MGLQSGQRRGRSWYQVLRVDPQAELEIVEAAYRRLAKKYYPDVTTSRDAGERMKEINAAYVVLRDPLQRAAYDRQLRERADAAQRDVVSRVRQEPMEPDVAPTAEGFLACYQHGPVIAAGMCDDCGAGLCEFCFDRFQPPMCSACLLAWAAQRRGEILMPVIWFFGVLVLLGGGLFWMSITPPALLDTNPGTVLIALAVIYVIASLPSGWRVVASEGGPESGEQLLWAVVLGAIVAPFRMIKVFVDLRRLGRLEALARTPE